MSLDKVKLIAKYLIYIALGILGWKLFKYAYPKFYDGTIVLEVQRVTEQMGVLGVLLVILINALRIIVPILPSEPFELLAGAMYGPVLGTIVCIIGITIGSAIVYVLVKRLEERFVRSVIGDKHIDKYMKLKNSPHIESITCYILLLPGMPKDLFTYIVGLTNIELKRFVMYVAIFRIPSALMSTIVGSNVLHGKWEKGLTIYIIFGAISLVGIGIHQLILRKNGMNTDR